MTLQEQVPLAPYTTLGIGGPARFFAEADSEEAVVEALDFAQARKLPVFVLGGGSNLLIADDGFPGLVLRIAIPGISETPPENNGAARVLVTGGAGEDWDAFVAYTVAQERAGLECLSGIPGSVGGSPVQNIGAYGQEVSETIHSVRVYDRCEKRIVSLDNSQCGFAYRRSLFNTSARERYVVLAVTFALVPGGPPSLRYGDVQRFFADRTSTPTLSEVRDAVRAIRARKSMLLQPGDPDCRSAGSFFKNPVISSEEFDRIQGSARARQALTPDETIPHYREPNGQIKVPAAWLIERAHFHRGYARGQAGLSTKHALAIVNRGAATAAEILALVDEIQTRVREHFGVTLLPEPVFVGFAPA